MYIIQIATECAPVTWVGGLGDVVLGLIQMIGLKYGTVPVVRATSGLADRVFDADNADKPYHEQNGYTFNDFDNGGIDSALSRAIGMWHACPKYFRQLMENGMRCDHSWHLPGQQYLDIYENIRDK